MSQLKEATIRLQNRIESEDYKGFDPYDALNSRFFNLPVLRNNKMIRFLSQQVVKRSFINLRPLLFVPKGENPVTVGLCIQGYAYLQASGIITKQESSLKIDALISRLVAMIPEGFNGACWGYDFDWEARYANIPAYQPTVVATGIISNGLYEAYKITKNNKLAELVTSAANFVRKDLNKSLDADGHVIYSYSPFDKQRVYNASMKGVRLLAQAYSISKEEDLLKEAINAAGYVSTKQNSDGSWFYSEAKGGDWVDNYHTGYVLDCLSELNENIPSRPYSDQIAKGLSYYRDTFVGNDGQPYFYSHNKWPIDCTGGGQQILSLTRFNHLDEAELTADFMIRNMQKKNGGFAFRKFKNYAIRTEFMRWSNAWMFSSMAYLLYKKNVK